MYILPSKFQDLTKHVSLLVVSCIITIKPSVVYFMYAHHSLLQFKIMVVRMGPSSDSQLSRCQYPDDLHDLEQGFLPAFFMMLHISVCKAASVKSVILRKYHHKNVSIIINMIFFVHILVLTPTFSKDL